MKKISLIIFILTLTSFQNKKNNELNGKTYIGYEQDIYSHGTSPTYQTILSLKNDSVLVICKVVSITNKDTLNFKDENYSYQYKGIVKKEKNNIEFTADAYKCENCETVISMDEVDENGEPKEFLVSRIYKGFITKNGLRLNGRNFKLLQ